MKNGACARDVMDVSPVLLNPDDLMSDAARKIMERRYRSLAVVDKDGVFLGVITVSVMLKLTLPTAATMSTGLKHLNYVNVTFEELWHRFAKRANDLVANHVITNPITVAPDTPLLEVLFLIYKQRTNLPVIEKGTRRLKGMISYYDIGEHIMHAGQNDG